MNRNFFRIGGRLAFAILLWTATGASHTNAQPAPPPPPTPAPPQPPQPYPYGPPPGYGSYPQPYYPVYEPVGPPPDARFRSFQLQLGLGLGTVTVKDSNGSDTGSGGGFHVRAGFGLTPGWLVSIGIDESFATIKSSEINQWALLFGAEAHFLSRLYARAAMGFATVAEEIVIAGFGETHASTGPALHGGFGVEIVQGYNLALAVEYSFQLSRAAKATWIQNLVGLGVHFF